ncbi:MAG: UbiD family decarboxylase [Betaproteobacteria bacterium]|nr:UbiD family decarboxylase [Betaproteobacteria bacterium]
MTHRTMRDFLTVLESQGLLRRVSETVDRMWEPAALAKWVFHGLPTEQRFGMYFEKVKGSDIPIVTGALGANPAAYATALDVAIDGTNDAWVKACRNPIAPKIVDKAPCQEVVISGKDVRLSYLPIPVWTPGKDKGPYITTMTVTKDCDTGVQNFGVYRTMVRDESSVVCNLPPGRQGYMCTLTWTDKGKVAPIAWVIAAPPAVHLAGVANLPYGADEINIAGGMMGAPVQMVKCKTVDLMVPADAEIIIEGEIHPGETDIEGPFGESDGYIGPITARPLVRITAITHRRNPIYYGYTSQMPPSESTTIQSLTNAGVLFKTLRYDLGESGVTDVFLNMNYTGGRGHAIIATKPGLPGHSMRLGRLVAALRPFAIKRVTVVDDDVDIRDPIHVDWALNSRFSPARDTVLIDEVPANLPTGQLQLPSALSGKIICDATLKYDAGPFSLPPKEIMMKALDRWKQLDLPAFEMPKRTRLRIDRS